jgi:DNA-binding NarL/FixJ family response regulator
MSVTRSAEVAGLNRQSYDLSAPRLSGRVWVVDPRPVIRAGLSRLAAAASGSRVYACDDLSVARELPGGPLTRTIAGNRSGTLLLGLRAGDDVEAQIEAARLLARVVIVVLDGDDPGVIEAALRASADGYVLVDLLDLDTLRAALIASNEGACPIPPELGGPWRTGGARVAGLSSRTLEVLRSLADGLHDDEIATQLGIGASSVRKHVLTAQARLRARTRTQAVAMAARRGLL